jgi:hypothetical protein
MSLQGCWAYRGSVDTGGRNRRIREWELSLWMNGMHIILVHRRLVVNRSPNDKVLTNAVVCGKANILEEKNVRLRLVYFVVFPP